MPQIIPAVATLILEVWGAVAVSMPVWAPTAATYAAYAVVAAGTYASIRSMQKIPAFGNLQSDANGKITMTRDTIASRRVIYGINRVSGPILFISTNSSNFSGKNEFLHMIVGIAGHEVSEFKNIFFNDVVAFSSGSGQSTIFPADKLAMTYKVGTNNQTAYVMTPATEWTSDHRLNGIASIYAKLVADPAVYPNGIPNISAVVVGHKLYDVDNTPVSYYDNPSLILLHYLKNYFGATSDEINTASFAAARDVCNYEPYGAGTGKRYTCNYTFLLNTKPATIIENILKSCYGKLAYSNGQFIIKAGAYSTPTVSLNEDDLIGGITVTTKTSQANAFNSVRGIYIDGNPYSVSNAAVQPDEYYTSSYQASDFVPITSSFYLNEDNGIENPIDLEMPSVSDHTVARRIAKLTLLDSRQDLTVSLTTKISGLQLIAGDNVYLSLKRYGWENKVFEVNELNINTDLSIAMVLKETAATIYDFPVDEDVDRDLSPNTNLPSPFSVVAPFGFSAVETTTIDKDGTVFPSATLSWSASYSGSIADVALEFKNTASANFDALALVSRTDNTFTTLDVVAGNTYMFRARNVNYLGVYSPFVSSSLYIGGDNTAPQTPTNIVATGGSGSFSLTWTNPAVDTDYKFTRIWLNTANNFGGSTLEGTISGTTWNKTISSSSIYYAWLQNIDTSNNTSSVSSPVNATVAAIGAGATGASGSAGNIQYQIYRRSATQPSTPTGNLTPAFWSTSIPADDGNTLWVSNGIISGADGITLIGSWSTPERLNGKVSWYQTTAPTGVSLAIGDLWWDTDDNYKPYRWNGSTWQAVDDGRITPISQSVVNYGDQYALTVTTTGTNRVSGFRILNQSSAASEFVVQADVFKIYNTTTAGITQSFVADANGVYMPQALIRELDAGKITAGTINATVKLTAAKLESPEITGSGIMINSQNGMRYQDNNGNFIITGGSANGESNGAQIDLVGVGGGGAGTRGTLVLSAGNVGTTSGDGTIRFRTAATEQGQVQRNGTLYWNNGVDVRGTSNRLGDNHYNNNSIEVGFYDQADRATYIDFISSTAATDYDFRIIRDSGTNGNTSLSHKGNGNIYFNTDGTGKFIYNADVDAPAFNTTSGLKYKTNIRGFYTSLDILNKLEAKMYDLKDGSKKNVVGLIAEEVNEVYPQIVGKDSEGKPDSIDYSKLTPLLLTAIKEQQLMIENLRQRITILERR